MRGELQQVGRHWIYCTMVYIGAAHWYSRLPEMSGHHATQTQSTVSTR